MSDSAFIRATQPERLWLPLQPQAIHSRSPLDDTVIYKEQNTSCYFNDVVFSLHSVHDHFPNTIYILRERVLIGMVC